MSNYNNLKNFSEFYENNKSGVSDSKGDANEGEVLSDDVQDMEDDIETGMEVDIEDSEGNKLNSEEFEIESILDVIVGQDKEEDKYGNSTDEAITTHLGPETRDYKRGETIYISALIRKKGTTSFNSPAKTAVLKCRIVDIYFGLQYLKKVIN